MSFNYIKKFGGGLLGSNSNNINSNEKYVAGNDDDATMIDEYDDVVRGNVEKSNNEGSMNASYRFHEHKDDGQAMVQSTINVVMYSRQTVGESVTADSSTENSTTMNHGNGNNTNKEEEEEEEENFQQMEEERDFLNDDEGFCDSRPSNNDDKDRGNESGFWGEVKYEGAMKKAKKWTHELETMKNRIEDARVSRLYFSKCCHRMMFSDSFLLGGFVRSAVLLF
jgi:hypothetical protein